MLLRLVILPLPSLFTGHLKTFFSTFYTCPQSRWRTRLLPAKYVVASISNLQVLQTLVLPNNSGWPVSPSPAPASENARRYSQVKKDDMNCQTPDALTYQFQPYRLQTCYSYWHNTIPKATISSTHTRCSRMGVGVRVSQAVSRAR